MSRMKTFGIYLALFVALYIFVSIVSIWCIKTTYATMEGNIQSTNGINIKVEKAESTFVNGYITGTISNSGSEQPKYVKIDLFSSKDNKILTKYIQIDELKNGEIKNFTVNFEAENIKKYEITIVDEYSQEEQKATLINLKDAENEEIKGISIFLAAIILLKYVIL